MSIASRRTASARIERVLAEAFTIPTDAPESDGTIAWHATTIVIARVLAGGTWGLGYSYAESAARDIIVRVLAEVVRDIDAMDVPAAWVAMGRAVRNIGRPGVASCAIAALDNALWDLKARLLGVPLVALLGATREGVAAYGSGGFTSYTIGQLQAQLSSWAEQGMSAVKMKIGRDPSADVDRVRAAREAIGTDVELFVDANGAYSGKQALAFADRFAEYSVTWFEEPVSSDDLAGLRLLRERVPGGIRIAAGEYGWDSIYFRRMLAAGAVDVLQADATRCGGISGFLRAAALCEAYGMPLSAHTAPSLHTHLCCAAPAAINVEYFHDHARIERMLFDGAREPHDGILTPDRARPGLGLELRAADAQRFAA